MLRKLSSLCILATVLTTNFVQAQEQDTEKDRKFHLSIGFSPLFFGDKPSVGGDFAFGYTLPSKKYLLALEIGGGKIESEKIGDYSYVITTTSAGKVISTETKNDGEVLYDYSLMEYAVAWNWLFDISEKWKFRTGPRVGFIDISCRDSYSPTSYKGVTIEGLPESQSVSKQAPMGGLIAGLTYNFSKRWFLDVNYRLSVNTGINFAEKDLTILGRKISIESKEFGSIGNRINLSLGWIF